MFEENGLIIIPYNRVTEDIKMKNYNTLKKDNWYHPNDFI